MLKRWKQFAGWPRFAAAALCVMVLLAAGAAVWHGNPGVAARGAEVLRGLIGDQNVARLETWVLGWQDTVQGWAYALGGDRPQAPFASATPARVAVLPTGTASPFPAVTDALPAASTTPGGGGPLIAPTPLPPSPTAAAANQPLPLKPMGQVAGEGAWSVFMTNPAGQPVGFRTFLQPDPQRPYSAAAVVAIDLNLTRLHYVLGTIEPVAFDPTLRINRPGRIPPNDFKSGLLVAAFNGGFRTRHGQFGVMINGVVLLAPRDGLGTVAIFDDGHVTLGPWGDGGGIFYADGLRNWRQNGPLILQKGQINPHTADPSPEDWGYTVGGDTATWRSSIGLSADGHTLYYVGGPFLTLPALAATMADTGAANAIQLDINAYWVNFEAIHYSAGALQSQLLMDGMKNDDRYLRSFDRDFFYVTANPN